MNTQVPYQWLQQLSTYGHFWSFVPFPQLPYTTPNYSGINPRQHAMDDLKGKSFYKIYELAVG